MGKQINYYMDYESFLKIAQAALDEGCLILRREHLPIQQKPKNSLDIITADYSMYWFYMPELAELEYRVDNFGNYYIKSNYNPTSIALIEAGFSNKSNSQMLINRSRLYVPTGYYDENSVWTTRSEQLTKVYDKLVQVVKRNAPSTEIEYDYAEYRDGIWEGAIKKKYKTYISSRCMEWRTQGYEIFSLKKYKEDFEKYLECRNKL